MLREETSNIFRAIATHIQGDFICSGSFPAYMIAKELQKVPDCRSIVELKYNDIDRRNHKREL